MRTSAFTHIQMNLQKILTVSFLAAANIASADIGIISAADAKKLIESPDAKARPIVFDTRGGYKDYFRGHIPNVRLYEGAWKEYVWLKDKSLPAETGGEAAGK